MKHLILSVIALCLVQFQLSAHDYQAVYSHRTALFSNSAGAVTSMYIDSVKLAGDSVLYPFKSIQKVDDNCYTPYGASWLGESVVIKPHGCIFVNQNHETIEIKTNTGLNERWMAYSNKDFVVFASLEKVELLTFCGLTDSVKTIRFTMAIPTGAPAKIKTVNNEWDGQTIQISKHYGLLKIFNMYCFPYPDETTKNYTGSWDQYELIGLTNPTVGTQNLTWLGVHDFQVGDEIHTKYNYFQTQAGPSTQRRSYTTLRYLSRQNFVDSILYKVDRMTIDSSFYGTNLTSSGFKHVVEKKVYKKNPVFDLLPGKAYVDNYGIGTVVMQNKTSLSKSFSNYIPFDNQINCWGYDPRIISDVCIWNSSEYLKGLGGPYEKWEAGCWVMNISGGEDALVYCKKGTTTWGTPLVIKQPDYFTKNMFWTEKITSLFGCGTQGSYVYQVANDTIIDGKTYKQILNRKYNGGVVPYYTYLGAIREENGCVYGKLPYAYELDPATEVKLYDFNLQQGDSVTTNLPYAWVKYSKPIVSSIDTITLLNGVARKRFYLSNGDVWIEGIGSMSGFFRPFEPQLTCGVTHQLMCFVNTEEELYHNPAVYYSGACGKLSAVDVVKDNGRKITVLPNPVSDWLTVNFEDSFTDCSFELLDINGRMTMTQSMNAFSSSINLSSLKSGLYMYRLTAKGKVLKAGRILKQQN